MTNNNAPYIVLNMKRSYGEITSDDVHRSSCDIYDYNNRDNHIVNVRSNDYFSKYNDFELRYDIDHPNGSFLSDTSGYFNIKDYDGVKSSMSDRSGSYGFMSMLSAEACDLHLL